MRLPQNKNYALVGGRTVGLEGVTVFNGSAWYASAKAAALVR